MRETCSWKYLTNRARGKGQQKGDRKKAGKTEKGSPKQTTE
jgi:hypothetical protein